MNKVLCSRLEKAVKTGVYEALSLLQGINPSPIKGIGLEYIDFREYCYGDDIRYIDWRISARHIDYSGDYKLFVKEFQSERKSNILLVLDTPRSMYYSDKIDMLVYIASFILVVANKMEDNVFLVILRDKPRIYKYPSINYYISFIARELCINKPVDRTNLLYLTDIVKKIKKIRGAIILTDYNHYSREYTGLLKLLKTLNIKNSFIIITTYTELNPIVKNGIITFTDLVNKRITITSEIKNLFKVINDHVKTIRALLKTYRVYYLETYGINQVRLFKNSIVKAYINAKGGLTK